jgi:hypothetical protein
MRTGAGVLDEKELALGLGFPRSAEQSDEDAEAAAVKGSANNIAGGGIFNYAETLFGANAIRLTGERGSEAGHMDSGFAIKIGSDHGAMECRKADVVEQVELYSCEVAVAEKWLGMLADQVEIEAWKKVVGTVPAADGSDESGVGIGERPVKIGKAMASRSGKKKWSALKGMGSQARLKAESAETIEPLLDAFLVGVGSGREHGDSCTGRDG